MDNFGRAVAVLLLLLGVSSSSSLALDPRLVGPQFQVNTYTTNMQGWPALAADSAGNFVVVWVSWGEDGSSSGVFGQRFDATAQPRGSEFQVNTYTTGGQQGAKVAAGPAGDFVVVWDSNGPDGATWGVFGQRFDAFGVPAGGEFQVNSYTTGYQAGGHVAMAGGGGFVVVWGSDAQDGSSWGVFGQRFSSAGDPLGGEFQVNVATTARQAAWGVTAGSSGDFVVIWESDAEGGPASDIFGRRFQSDGEPAGGEFRINTYTSGDQAAPALAGDDAGNFVVTWNSLGQSGPYWNVFAQRFDSTGGPLGGEFQVSHSTTVSDFGISVAAEGSGSFLVVWNRWNLGWSDAFAQRYDEAGGELGGELQLNTDTFSSAEATRVVAAGPRSFVTAWHSSGYLGAPEEIVGQRLATPFFADDFESGVLCGWSAAVGSGDSCP